MLIVIQVLSINFLIACKKKMLKKRSFFYFNPLKSPLLRCNSVDFILYCISSMVVTFPNNTPLKIHCKLYLTKIITSVLLWFIRLVVKVTSYRWVLSWMWLRLILRLTVKLLVDKCIQYSLTQPSTIDAHFTSLVA